MKRAIHTVAILTLLSSLADAQAPALSDLGRLGAFETRRESSSHEDLTRNGDARHIDAGETIVLGDLEGPGEITHMWCTVGSFDMFYPRSLVIRMYWDGSDEPSVEAPLGDFFGVGHGAHMDMTSAPVAVSSRGRARNFYWVMPFKKRARVTITNESTTQDTDSFYYYLDWRKLDSFPADAAYFHAQYRQEFPAKPGNYKILETKGRGHYVGTVYSALQMETGWFGEGDDFFYVDGEEQPSLRGTGTEDYFNDAWGFRQFNTPFHGVSLWEGYFPGDRVTAYRWHVDSPVAFQESLRLEIEHRGSIFTDSATHLGQFFERPDWVSSVAFWYQDKPVGPMEPMPPAADRIPPYRILDMEKEVQVSASPKAMVLKDRSGVTYIPSKSDAAIDFTFELDKPGRYQINTVMTYGFAAGVYQPFLDGEAIGSPIDFCETGQDPIWTRLDLYDLKAGKHTLRFEGRGPSPKMRSLAPKYFGLILNRLILLRMEDMEGYHRELEKELAKKK